MREEAETAGNLTSARTPTELSTNRKFCFSVNSIASQCTYRTRRLIISQIVYSARCGLCATCLEQSYSSCCPPCTELSDFGQTWIVESSDHFPNLKSTMQAHCNPFCANSPKFLLILEVSNSFPERKKIWTWTWNCLMYAHAGLLDLIRCATFHRSCSTWSQ